MLRSRPAGAGTPVDGPQPHGAHKPLHPLPAHHHSLSLQPDPHAPRPEERGLQVLPVHGLHQGQVLFRGSPGPVVQAGPAHSQQGALARHGQ